PVDALIPLDHGHGFESPRIRWMIYSASDLPIKIISTPQEIPPTDRKANRVTVCPNGTVYSPW
ncbi:hypothetical protein, partial [Actinomadura viridis]|uniref:hypothetical protein n=1 Tax=Actinomadura viridis TaxID=58110 RepID=UPI0031EC2F6C